MAFTQCEWNEDVFKGAAAGCSMFVSLANLMAEDMGQEKASEMLVKMGTAYGVQSGEMFKQQLGDEKPDAGKLGRFIAADYAKAGLQVETEHENGSFTLRVHNCPFAEAYKALGMDLEAGKKICEDFGLSIMHNRLKPVDPDGKAELVHFRETWDDFCEERFQLSQ